MKNTTELRKNLSEVFNQLRSGEIEVKQAAELSNIAGKMISSVKVELEYASLRKEEPNIDFLKAK